MILILGGKYIKKLMAGSMMKMNSLGELCTVITQLMVSAAQFTKTALSTQTGYTGYMNMRDFYHFNSTFVLIKRCR